MSDTPFSRRCGCAAKQNATALRQAELLCEAGVQRAVQKLVLDNQFTGEMWQPKVDSTGQWDATVSITVDQSPESSLRQVTVTARLLHASTELLNPQSQQVDPKQLPYRKLNRPTPYNDRISSHLLTNQNFQSRRMNNETNFEPAQRIHTRRTLGRDRHHRHPRRPATARSAAAREAARRCSCSNNLMQIGLSLHHFEFNAERLPSGVTNPDGPIRNEEIAARKLDCFDPALHRTKQCVSKIRSRSGRLRTSQQARARGGNQSASLSIESSSQMARFVRLRCITLCGCHHDQEAPIDENNTGVLFLNSRLRFSEVLDGLSQTILIGEFADAAESRGWVSGTRSTLRNTGSINDPKAFEWPFSSYSAE